jgi:hypothetical protein
LEVAELLAWYGIYLSCLPRDAALLSPKPLDAKAER